MQLKRGYRRADGWSSFWHTSWLIVQNMLMINTLLYTMPSFKTIQRWSCWKWRRLGLTRSFRNLLGILLISKVLSNGKRRTLCIHSHTILNSGNRWGTTCHSRPHTQLIVGEQSMKIVLRYQDGPRACSPFSLQEGFKRSPFIRVLQSASSYWLSFWTFFSPSIE